MSFWLKRVESFLEQVDQSAASQISTLKHEPGEHHDSNNHTDNQYTTTRTANGTTTKPKSSASAAPLPKPKDDDIFKFLNDDAPAPPSSSTQRLAMPAPKPKKEPKKEVKPKKITTTTPTVTPTPTPATQAPPSYPPSAPTPTPSVKPASPPSSPPITVPSVKPASPPPSPPRLPSTAQIPSPPSPTALDYTPEQPQDKEPDVIEAKEVSDDSSPTKPEISTAVEPAKEESVDTGGWEDPDFDVEESGKKSPVKAPSPHLDGPTDTDTQEKSSELSTEGEKETLAEATSVQSEAPPTTESVTHENGDVKEPVQEVEVAENTENGEVEAEAEAEAEEEGEGEGEVEEEEESNGGLDAEFVQKYNDMLTQNEKFARENKLMRQEVVKLHEEIHSLTNKNRSVAGALEQMNEVLGEHQKMAHEKDKQLIKMKQQEQELETALHAKDMQIAGARAQIEQGEKTLRTRDQALATYQERIEKLSQDKESLLDGNQRNAEMNLNRIEELDKLMADEKRQSQEARQQAKDREAELQTAVAEYTKALAIAQRGLDEKTLEVQRSTILLKEAQNESKTVRQEYVDYKLRATKVLQSKEKTIQELTERMTAGPDGGGNATANLGELLRTQQELLRAQQERDELSHTVDQLRANLQEVQSQAEADAEVFHSQLASSEEVLEKERKRVQALQIDMLTRSNESVSAHNESERALTELKETLKTRDAELAKLRKQYSSKSQSTSSQMELENRLRSTTDHLLQKQAQIDTLLSEKSFLQLQLENTLQAQHSDIMTFKRERTPYASKNDHVPISIKSSGPTEDDHDEPRIRHRSIASLVPANPHSPNFVSQRVVGAANFLDKMSGSAGRVMRQYPLARLGFIAYVFMIHLMVFYIMAAWNPEMHIDGLDDKPPG